MAIKYFLLILDPRVPNLEIKEFRDGRRASNEYARVEREHIDDPVVEIVLVGADSLDTLKVTHSHYFTIAAGQPVELARLAAS